MAELVYQLISEFKGSFPNVPYAPGISEDAFADEPDPFFVTLPIAKVGVTSRNGRTYDRAAVQRIVEQVNAKRPEGRLGHLPRAERATRYDLPALRWVGAVLSDDGTAWGKAFVPRSAENVREHLRIAKRTGSRVATSIYGTEGERGLADMNLETIDLADPERVGVPEVIANPQITSEMKSGGGNTVSDDIKIVSELLTGQLQEKTDLIAELKSEKKGLETQVSELTAKLAAAEGPAKLVAEIRTAVKADDKADVVKLISELVSEVATLKAKDASRERENWIAEFVTFKALRPTIALHLSAEVADKDAAKTAIAELMKREDIKLIAEALKVAKGGPAAVVAELNGGADNTDWRDKLAAEASATRKAKGI